MKIRRSSFDEAEELRLRSLEQQKQRQTRTGTTGVATTATESVTISALAREIESLDVPREDTVRADKVKDLKARIADGSYIIDSEAVARKVIEDLA